MKFGNAEYFEKIRVEIQEFKDLSGVLHPGDRYWNWFVFRLSGPEGINCDGERWFCDHTLRKSELILTRMGRIIDGIDVERTLRWFRYVGQDCDCKVWMNLDDDYTTPAMSFLEEKLAAYDAGLCVRCGRTATLEHQGDPYCEDCFTRSEEAFREAQQFIWRKGL